MRQDISCVTAPNDPTPKWPEGYIEVLREAGAKEKNIPYCIGWVQRFFSKHPRRAEDELGRTDIEGFLSEIASHPGISNWQVQQARNALELYYEKFRGLALSPRDVIISDHVADTDPISLETPFKSAQPDIRSECSILKTEIVYTRPMENVNREFEKHKIPSLEQERGVSVSPLGDSSMNTPHTGGDSSGRCNWDVRFSRGRLFDRSP